MEENYDMEALYLYNDGWQYRVGKIDKINDKSVRMEFGAKIKKEDFTDVHKLTDEEIKIFNKEFIKKLSSSISKMKDTVNLIDSLRKALKYSELACVDTKKLQEKLDILNETLVEELKPIEIGGKKLNFNDYSERLIEVE